MVSLYTAWLCVWRWLDLPTLLLFLAVYLLFADYVKHQQPSSFPHGPTALPFVGNLFSVDYSKAHENLTQLSQRYGDVYSLRMGQIWMVVVNGFESMKEALVTQGDSLADRPKLPLQEDISHSQGVITTNGQLWKQQRRFAISTLKQFGAGKNCLEPAILEEFTHLASEILGHGGKPFPPHLMLSNAVSNIICSLVFGHRFEYNDEEFMKMKSQFDRALQIEGSIWAQLYNSFPFLMRRIPGPHQTVQNIWNKVKDLIRAEIRQHKEDRDPRDYIDCYLTEIHMRKGDTESHFDEENLVMCSLDLFVAGSETITSTLRWAILYMAKYREIQEKVQAEIDAVIGPSNKPSMVHRGSLPYTDAVIHEIQRMSNVVPLSLPHVTTRDIQLGDYTVPKGVTVIPNLTSVLFDKKEWETPSMFNPGHFLNKEGNFVKRAAYIPFSAGKRVCPGENLARMELFLFFTSLMQMFTFSMPTGVTPVFDAHFQLTLAPLPYEICATQRQL